MTIRFKLDFIHEIRIWVSGRHAYLGYRYKAIIDCLHFKMEVFKMANSNRSNRVEVPEAKAAMDRFKTEVASELGVNLKEGYNGDLTSREAGSIGGEMVRRMIKKQEESMK